MMESPTLKTFLHGISSLISDEAVPTILAKRGLSSTLYYDDLDQRDKDLLEAEAYWWLSNLPVGGGTVKDVDGNWSRTEGGWQVSSANISEWRRKYADLMEKWGETPLSKSKIRIFNL